MCRFRWLAVLMVIGASVAGGIGAMKLTEPPTSEPPLFHVDHNVQFFWRCAPPASNRCTNAPMP